MLVIVKKEKGYGVAVSHQAITSNFSGSSESKTSALTCHCSRPFLITGNESITVIGCVECVASSKLNPSVTR